MSIINDPDFLDRFQVIVDSVWQTISLRGSGVNRTFGATGSGDALGRFIDGNKNFTALGVVSGDILAVTSDQFSDGGVMGHYMVHSIPFASGLVLDRPIGQTSGSGIYYRVFADGPYNSANPSLNDGVTLQALYSFLKEEWRTNSLGASGQDLIKYTFPMVSITSEQFEIGGPSNANWEFADNSGNGDNADISPRNLIRTGGWASVNSSGEIINNYPSIVTLGSLDADAQVYYQLTSSTTNPVNFVLTGPVNQAIQTLTVAGGATVDGKKSPVGRITGNVSFNGNRITDNNNGDLIALGYASGELVQVRRATDSTNNGLFTIIGSGSNFLDTNFTFTTRANDSVAILSPVTDNRSYLTLRVRKKARSYVQSAIEDIGVTTINTIVNRFPLSHVNDPAIVLDDGALNGDGTNTAFQSSASVETGVTATLADNGNGTFTLTQSGATFNSGGVGAQLYIGDTVEITGPTSNPNIGVYEVSSVTSDTVVVLIAEPGRTVDTVTNAGAIEFTARSRVRVPEFSNGATADSATAGQGTFTDSTNTPFADVVAGDILRIKSGAYAGYYKVVSKTSNSVIEVNTLGSNSNASNVPEDQAWGSSSSVTYDILRAGMHLQYKSVTATPVSSVSVTTSNVLPSVNFTNANGYYVGGYVTVTGTTNSTDGTYVITSMISGTSITVANVSNPATVPSISATSASVTGAYGFVRKLGDYHYSFNWRLQGNGGDLAECFQFLQKQLRLTSDIDEGIGTFRGDITDLLMAFASPNGTTLNLFIDDVDQGVLNNLTQQDLEDISRNFPFTVALKISLNDNILNANTNKIVVFFTDNSGSSGDEFGTAGAVIVTDTNSTPMVAEDAIASPLTFTYDYTAGGEVNRDITIVCITDDTGQYVATTSTLTRNNEVNASLVAGLERNYSNP